MLQTDICCTIHTNAPIQKEEVPDPQCCSNRHDGGEQSNEPFGTHHLRWNLRKIDQLSITAPFSRKNCASNLLHVASLRYVRMG